MEAHGGTHVGPEFLGSFVVAHHHRPIPYPCLHTPLATFPNHPLSHPCQAASTPNLANFRSLKCTIYKAIEFGPMCTLRRSWSLFNDTACLFVEEPPEKTVTRNNHWTNAAALATRSHPRHTRAAGGTASHKKTFGSPLT